jgi:hypothetical protein
MEIAAFSPGASNRGRKEMERLQRTRDVDIADGTEDPPLSWLAEAALERWELLDRAQSKQKRPREPRG